MAAIEAIRSPAFSAADLIGLQSWLLETVSAGARPPTLLVCALEGRLVSIGRYHRYGGPAERGGTGCYRRLTGGRIYGAGEGWLGCSLVLPARAALLADRDRAIKPEQVMNRYARGFLGAMRSLGLEGFYPGRDAITVNLRELAMCSFETGASGAMLFELLIAVSRGLEDLAGDLERLDPEGTLTCALPDHERATTLAREIGREADFAEVAEAIESGFAAAFGALSRRDLTAAEQSEVARRGRACVAAGWLGARRPDPALDRVGRAASQLGFVEAHLALQADGTIARLTLAGDLIANSGGLEQFEREVRGCVPDLPSLTAAARRVYGGDANYLLGIGELSNLVQLIMKAS